MKKSFVFISIASVLVFAACTENPDDGTTTTSTTTMTHTTSSSHSGGSGGAGGSGGQGGAPEVNELRWVPPQGYIQNGLVVAVAFTQNVQDPYLHLGLDKPMCLLTEQEDGSYVCDLVDDVLEPLPAGEDLFYTIFHEDVLCLPGGWVFDQGNYTCGACDGESQCCGKSFGTATFTLHSVELSQEPVLNNTAPCVFNMKVRTSE